MKLEDLEKANNIVSRIRTLDNHIDELSSILDVIETENRNTLINMSVLGFKFSLQCDTDESKKLFKETTMKFKKHLEKQKKSLEDELEKL